MADPTPRLWIPLASGLAALALAADQLRLGWGARHAEVAHLLGAPPLWLWIPVTVLLLGALGVGLWAAQVKHNARLSRVPLLALVLTAFLYGLVTPPVRPLAPSMDAVFSVRAFGDEVRALTSGLGHLPATLEELEPAVAAQIEPPYLSRGAQIPRWSLVVRRDCSGPALEAAGLAAGTYLYCLAADAGSAWITAVGRNSSTFGPPELLQYQGEPVVDVITASEEPDAGP